MLALHVLNFCRAKMAERHDSSIFSSGKTHSRIPTIFFSSNKRKSEYLNTILEQSLLLTRWHQKECAHMNKTCTAIENITNDALSRIVKMQTRNSQEQATVHQPAESFSSGGQLPNLSC